LRALAYKVHPDLDLKVATRPGLLLAATAIDAAGGKLGLRVGIATGLAVAGDLIGTGASEEENVIGEAPNLAARLQTLAAPGTNRHRL
jgi:class 3 adenylate cyclase